MKADQFREEHGVSGVKVKVEASEGRFLQVSREVYGRNEALFRDYQVKKLKASYILIDP